MSQIEQTEITEEVQTLKDKLGLSNISATISNISPNGKNNMIIIRALIKMMKIVSRIPAVEKLGTKKVPDMGEKVKNVIKAIDGLVNELLIDSVMYKNI